MSTLGTFDGFTTMRLGIYAAQQGLRVTGNNISNINTVGYTRQRADQVSFKTGGSDRYASMIDKRVGNGVLISGINQIRDPFLDIRYRNASNDTYHYDTWLSGMQSIASILDEVGKGENRGDGLIYAQLQDLAEKLRSYSANPTIENDRLVRQSANALTGLFRKSAERLDQLYADTKTDFYKNIDEVNQILYNIRDLDKAIREAEIHGDKALEMRDERNLQIDKLSQYLDIKVEYSYEDVGGGIQVEKLTISLYNANPDKTVTSDESILVDGLYATQLSVPEKLPMLNGFADGEKYAYLEGYTYLTARTADQAQEFFDALTDDQKAALGLTSIDDLFSGKDADGNKVYYLGVNDEAQATPVDNEKLIIHLDKLLNSKGEEWENTTTQWVPVTGTKIDVGQWISTFEKYDDLKVGSKFGVNNIEYTVVDDNATAEDLAGIANPVKFSQVKDSAALAKFVYDHLDLKSDKYSPYNAVLKGNQIIFTAKDPATANGPDLNDVPDDNGLFDVDTQPNGTVSVSGPPEDINLNEYPRVTYDEDGNRTTVAYTEVDGQWYQITIKTQYTHEVTLDDNDLRGIIQAQRELLTEEGEFASEYDVSIDENALTKRGILYYQKSLDLLAQRIAEEYNKLNSGYLVDQEGYYINAKGERLVLEEADGTQLYVKKGELTEGQLQNLLNNAPYYTVDENGNKVPNLNKWLEDHGGMFEGGVLFSNSNSGDDPTGINAHNIDISYGWSNGKWNLVPTFTVLFSDEDGSMSHSTQNDNADHMLAMIDNSLTYNPRDLYGSDAIGPVLFKGSFNDMLSNMMAVEADDARVTNLKLTTSATTLEELDFAREGVSGVDLNDEAMNMVQYQKAMNAAMRLMTAIDEALERLINNTGIAGR